MSFNFDQGYCYVTCVNSSENEVPNRKHWSSVFLRRFDVVCDFVEGIDE